MFLLLYHNSMLSFLLCFTFLYILHTHVIYKCQILDKTKIRFLAKVYKSLKMPKEAVHQKRTDNTMTKRKRTNKNVLQNTTQKTKDRTPQKCPW